MKLALIPPYAHLDRTVDDYHLLLPQCFNNADYCAAVVKHREADHYIILDNGVGEDIYTTPSRLHELGFKYEVDEIVMQDVQHDAKATLDAVYEFSKHIYPASFGYMAVVQGKTLEECKALIEVYVALDFITCIGIPRHLLRISLQARHHLAEIVRELTPDKGIHMLGTSPDYIRELHDYGAIYRELNVRGVDTSAPFNYALDNKWIGDGDIVPRPKSYFAKTIRPSLPLTANIETMSKWVHGD